MAAFQKLARLALIASGCALLASGITLSTSDSLSLTKGVYASILFTAGNHSGAIPVLYHFSESGNIPPGMIFESNACNKPGQPACASVARADGIFLDGVPSAEGSYTVTVTAKDSKGNRVSKRFTITVRS